MKKIRPTCDQCLHHEHCYDLLDATDCAAYKDNLSFVEIPCRMGDYFTVCNELYEVKGLTLVETGEWYINGMSVIDGAKCNVVHGSQEILSKEEAQQWLNEHGYDDILIGEMHE